MDKETMKTWAIVIAIVMALVSMFVWDTANTTDDVIKLKPQVEMNTENINSIDEKFENWKTHWELPLDVAQNKDIEYLKKHVDKLDREVDQVKEIIQDIEIEISS